MKDTSMQFLLAEYEHQRALEQARIENYERILQLYLTLLTASTGFLILMLERQATSSLVPAMSLLLGFILLLGEVGFLRLIGIDIALADGARAFLLIRDRFVREDSELVGCFLKGIAQDQKRYRSWSSVGGVIARAFTVTQQKTMVVVINCIVTALLVVILIKPSSTWLDLAVGVITAVVTSFLHAIYASWRYRSAAKQLFAGETIYWV